MSKADLHMGWATHKAARMACERWHYSGCLPTGKLVKIGAWESGKFIGVVIFSRGVCGHFWNRFGLDQTTGCELTRVAFREHRFQTSRAVAVAIRMLKSMFPEMKLVVSFAAQTEGHHGGIYQAGNWIYDGQSAFKQEYILNGRRVVDRTVSQLVRERKLRRNDLRKVDTKRKHRYLMPLDAAMRAQIEPLRQPYPKRPKQATADTIGTAAGQHRPGRSNQQATA